MRLGDVGEFGLISRWTTGLGGGTGVVRGVGDDAAVLRLGGQTLLVTTDTLVEGVHFRIGFTGWRELGRKVLAVNVSDIAAMGGRPLWAVISLGLPPEMAVEDADAFYAGLVEAARDWGLAIVGGDTVASPSGAVFSVTVIGEPAGERVLYRSGALPGDWIGLTGPLGASAAGLYLFQHPDIDFPVDLAHRLRMAHLLPEPRLIAGLTLACCSGVTAATDLSDGLYTGLEVIAGASNAGCIIHADKLPLAPGVGELAQATGIDPLDLAVYGGEDYELLFTVRPDSGRLLEEACKLIGLPCHWLGTMTDNAELLLVDPVSGPRVIEAGGFHHFPREDRG